MPKSHKFKRAFGNEDAVFGLVDRFHNEFCQFLAVEWPLPVDLSHSASEFLLSAGEDNICPRPERRKRLISIINAKFHINRKRVKAVIDEAARRKVFFTPQEKAALTCLYDSRDISGITEWINALGEVSDGLPVPDPVAETESLLHLRQELHEATIHRSDARQGVQEERKQSILRSLFGSWLFCISDGKFAYAFNSGLAVDDIEDDYYDHLRKCCPRILSRSCGAAALAVNAHQMETYDSAVLRNWLFREIYRAYGKLDNYSYLLIWFTFPENEDYSGKTWEMIHDSTLYAERCQACNLKSGFFHPEKILEATTSHIQTIDAASAQFSVHQHGFVFRDCIVVCPGKMDRRQAESRVESVVLLLEKCVADETAIPCPACRSLNIRGNSYPAFGVKSWECQNPICPERSAFDRGNRFSGINILRTSASQSSKAEIPEDSLRKWKLDVVEHKDAFEILDMFVRHYSFPGDHLVFVNWEGAPDFHHGRIIELHDRLAMEDVECDPLTAFESTPFFNRYLNAASVAPNGKWRRVKDAPQWLELYHGSCLDVLNAIEESSVDGAVTSPPYYNAREYSTWPNIYCYLYDMKMAAEGVHRALKPGAYYLFNIFDYFDNDNVLAFSALGKRRLSLGACMNQIFRKCGFEIAGNIVWHKGEIEGKRNYNQGNRNPFYQLPLNTWEHILVLKKPGRGQPGITFPGAIYCKPVFKWVNGENRHGHSAPFPEDIPALLCSQLSQEARVLDPFAGSLTTAMVCKHHGQHCISIEIHEEYCNLGLKRLSHAYKQLSIFD